MLRSSRIFSRVLVLPSVAPRATTGLLQALEVLQPAELGGSLPGDGAIDGAA